MILIGMFETLEYWALAGKIQPFLQGLDGEGD
jgi:hypothetical protein